MGLSRNLILPLVTTLALAGCGDALWPTTDGPDPAAGSSAPSGESTGAPAVGPGPSQTQTAQSSPPPAVSQTAPQPAATTPQVNGQANGTFVGKKVVQMNGDLTRLSQSVRELQGRFDTLRNQTNSQSQRFHTLVASVEARLQQGTTPGNPILAAQWNEAQGVLEQFASSLPQMTKLSNDAADQAAFGQFLMNSVQATFGLSGAVEEDHRNLQILEDSVHQNLVLIDRLMNDLSQDINRQTSYVSNQRQNLTTLSLAIKNGELFGTSLATRAFTQTNITARARAQSELPEPGERPLVIIRFDRPNVDFQQALFNAVSQALARKPEAVFNLVAVHPSRGTPSQIALNSSAARRNAEQVLRTLTDMGVPSSRVNLVSTGSDEAGTNEVHLYVR